MEGFVSPELASQHTDDFVALLPSDALCTIFLCLESIYILSSWIFVSKAWLQFLSTPHLFRQLISREFPLGLHSQTENWMQYYFEGPGKLFISRFFQFIPGKILPRSKLIFKETETEPISTTKQISISLCGVATAAVPVVRNRSRTGCSSLLSKRWVGTRVHPSSHTPSIFNKDVYDFGGIHFECEVQEVWDKIRSRLTFMHLYDRKHTSKVNPTAGAIIFYYSPYSKYSFDYMRGMIALTQQERSEKSTPRSFQHTAIVIVELNNIPTDLVPHWTEERVVFQSDVKILAQRLSCDFIVVDLDDAESVNGLFLQLLCAYEQIERQLE